MSVVWRTLIKGQDIHSFLDKHQLSPESTRDEGFNILISDSENIDEQKEAALSFVVEKSSAIMSVSELGGISEIDFALYVGGKEHFTQSMRFTKNELSTFAKSGVEVRISGYPSSDT